MQIEIRSSKPTANYRTEMLIGVSMTEEEAHRISPHFEREVYKLAEDYVSKLGYFRVRAKVLPYYLGEHNWNVRLTAKYTGG